ncbi:MAG: hypothetical protein HY347_04370 [candidate division NC10 bacterium]|nr:hypothetical protein [candidate division NC10 bacterium]
MGKEKTIANTRSIHRDDIHPEALVRALRALSPQGRKELIVFLRSGTLPVSPEDSHALARLADLLEILLD